VHRLVAEDTVEEKILELHARKRALASSVIEGVQTPSLTREDLIALLS
jgi:SNF2 family DNA or RNA helicase